MHVTPFDAGSQFHPSTHRQPMSVLLETSLGDLVIDLEAETCPILCANFLKLCKIYYYNLNAFFNGEAVKLFEVELRHLI